MEKSVILAKSSVGIYLIFIVVQSALEISTISASASAVCHGRLQSILERNRVVFGAGNVRSVGGSQKCQMSTGMHF
jgi:hypothetical protein